MIFAVPRTMPLLGRKIQSECSPGTDILAYRFKMPLKTTTKDKVKKKNENSNVERSSSVSSSENSDDENDLRLQASCIYDQEEMRIYRMGE